MTTSKKNARKVVNAEANPHGRHDGNAERE